MRSNHLLIPLLIIIALPVFAQQTDMSMIPYRKGNLWGYASPDKTMLITPAYEQVNFFYEGYASVKKGSKFGYINKEGKVVIPFNYYTAKPFRFGYVDNGANRKSDTVLFAGASLRQDGYEICITTNGTTMPKCPAIKENSVAEDKLTNLNTYEKVYSNIVANGNVYDKIVDDYKMNGGDDTYYIAMKNNIMGILNNKFEVVVPFEYSTLKKLGNSKGDLLLTEKNNLSGILNTSGSVYLPVENNRVSFIKTNGRKEYLVVAKNGIAELKDIQLANVINGNYSDIMYDNEGGFILTGTNKLQGYYFTATGKLVTAKFSNIKQMIGGEYIIASNQAGRSGYINSNGTEFFED